MRWPCHMHAVMLRYREIVLQDCSEKWVVLSYHCASARPYTDVHMHACHGLYTVALGVLVQLALSNNEFSAYSADIGIPLTQPPISAVCALCLRSWLAFWTVSLNLTVCNRRYDGFSVAVDVRGSS